MKHIFSKARGSAVGSAVCWPVAWLAISCCLVAPADSWCIGIGANPTFVATPTIKQLDIQSVYISWSKIVQDLECADNFLVSYWIRGQPHDYKLTEFLSAQATGITISDLRPNVPYVFEVIARENKGVLGIDYNRSPKISFTISRSRRRPTTTRQPSVVSPASDNKEETNSIPDTSDNGSDGDVVTDYDDEPSLNEIAKRIQLEEENRKANGSHLFTIIGCVVGLLIVILVGAGVAYQLLKSRRRRRNTLLPGGGGTADMTTTYDRMKENVAIDVAGGGGGQDCDTSTEYDRDFSGNVVSANSNGTTNNQDTSA